MKQIHLFRLFNVFPPVSGLPRVLLITLIPFIPSSPAEWETG